MCQKQQACEAGESIKPRARARGESGKTIKPAIAGDSEMDMRYRPLSRALLLLPRSPRARARGCMLRPASQAKGFQTQTNIT
jgi:hypothetical protein